MRVRGNNSASGQDSDLSWPKRLLHLFSPLTFKLIKHNWVLILVDQGVVSGTSFLVAIIIGRTCGKEQLGLYILGTSIVAFINLSQEFTIWSPYAIFSPRLTGSAHSLYTGSTLLHQWASSGIALVVLAGAGICLSGWTAARGMQPVIWMLVVVGSFIAFREYVRRVCFVRLQMKAVLLLDCGVAIIMASGIFLLAYLGKLSAARAFGVIGLGCALAGLAWFFWARKSLAFSLKQAALDLKHNWSFGKRILLATVAVSLSHQLSLWFLTIFHGPSAVGILAACQGVVYLANPFILGSALFLQVRTAHVFAQGGIDKLRGLVIKSTMVIALSMSLFCVAIIVLGDRLVTFIYGFQYAGHSLLLATLAISVLADFLHYGIFYGLLAMEKSGFILTLYLLRAGIILTIGVWLVYTYGPLGAAAGYLIAGLVTLVTPGFFFIKLFYSAEIPEKV